MKVHGCDPILFERRRSSTKFEHWGKKKYNKQINIKEKEKNQRKLKYSSSRMREKVSEIIEIAQRDKTK